MRGYPTRLLAIGLLLLGAAPLAGHHAFEAEYDPNDTTDLAGVVTKVDWVNPHAYVFINVEDEAGNELHESASFRQQTVYCCTMRSALKILRRIRLLYFVSIGALSFLSVDCAAVLPVTLNCGDVQILSHELTAQEAERNSVALR